MVALPSPAVVAGWRSSDGPPVALERRSERSSLVMRRWAGTSLCHDPIHHDHNRNQSINRLTPGRTAWPSPPSLLHRLSALQPLPAPRISAPPPPGPSRCPLQRERQRNRKRYARVIRVRGWMDRLIDGSMDRCKSVPCLVYCAQPRHSTAGRAAWEQNRNIPPATMSVRRRRVESPHHCSATASSGAGMREMKAPMLVAG